jgi:hypothetical protein
MDKKLSEVRDILKKKVEVNINEKIKEFKKKYQEELDGFTYIDDKIIISTLKNKFIRYIGFNGLLNYGGFLYKVENGLIYLINKDRRIWKINIDQNFIFYKDIIKTNNDLRRNAFDIFLKNYS